MNPRHALMYGLTSALHQHRTVLAMYLISLLSGLVLLVPLLPLIGGALGHSATGTGIESHLDVAVIADLLRVRSDDFGLFHRFASVVIVLYLVLATFLSGGILAVLLSPRERGWISNFFSGCGRYFGRFGRLLVLQLAFLAVAAAANHAGNLANLAMFEDSTHALAATVAMWLKQGIMIVVFVAVATVFDYARILTVLHDRHSMTGAVSSAVAFAARNAAAVIALRAAILAAAGAALLVYWTVGRWILPASSWLTLLALQQMVILVQKFLTVLQYAAELNLYRGRELSEDARLLSRLTDPDALRSALS